MQKQGISFALINDVSQSNGLQVHCKYKSKAKRAKCFCFAKAKSTCKSEICKALLCTTLNQRRYNSICKKICTKTLQVLFAFAKQKHFARLDLYATSKRWQSNLFVLPLRLLKIQRKALVSQHCCKKDTKQIVDSHPVVKLEKTKFKFVRKTILKSFKVKEHVVTFSKLVPKKLFLIQSIQNPCKTHYTIVRPLINCSRHTITMACGLNSLPVYPDISNKKVRYSRNRIRKQVIPSLQFFFNPEVEKALLKFSEHN